MARSEALAWWPGAAEALVVIGALATLYAGRGVRAEPPDAGPLPAEASDADAADDDAADTEADDHEADDDVATDDVATDEEATDTDASDADADETDEIDATAAESRAANSRASGALDRAERDESHGDYVECARKLAPVMWRMSMVSNGDLTEAVETTFNRCNDELEAQYARIEPRDCRLNIRDAIATTAAPAVLVPRAAKGACLALVPGSAKTQPPDDFGIVCPRVALVWSAGGLHRRELAFDGGPLDDTSWCCKLESIAAGTLDGKTLVRVGGVGHPCGGGTAYEATDALYEWNGKSLASPLDISIAFH